MYQYTLLNTIFLTSLLEVQIIWWQDEPKDANFYAQPNDQKQ